MSVTLPGDGTVVATANVGGAEQQIVQVSTLPAVTGTVALDSASLAALESITVQSSVLPTGAATDATLTAMSAKLPAQGQAVMASSQPVTIASNQSAVPVSGTVALSAGAAAIGTVGVTALPALPAGTNTIGATTVVAATYVDKSGTITAGGTAQTAIALNASRRGFSIQNNSAGDLWFNTLATAVQSQPSMVIPAGSLYESPYGGCPTGAVSIIGATTAQAFSAREW